MEERDSTRTVHPDGVQVRRREELHRAAHPLQQLLLQGRACVQEGAGVLQRGWGPLPGTSSGVRLHEGYSHGDGSSDCDRTGPSCRTVHQGRVVL